jgi:tetratricopeptide (TPR) repeat protein
VPNDLAPLYPHPGPSLNAGAATAAALFVVAVSMLTVALNRRLPYLFVGWFWFVGTLVPGIGLVQVGNLARADHFTYVPLIGIFLMLTWAVADLLRRAAMPLAAPFLAGVVLLLCALSTRLQINYWKDSLALWEHTVEVTSNNFAAHRAYGFCLLEKDRFVAALEQFDAGLRLWPGDAKALEGRGRALVALGRNDQAFDTFQAALRLDPTLCTCHYYVGRIYLQRGLLDDADASLRASLKYNSQGEDAWYQRGVIRLVRKNYAEAEEFFDEAIRVTPDRPEMNGVAAQYRVARGEALLRLNRAAEAIPVLTEAVGLDPGLLRARFLLADAQAEVGKFTDAIATVDKVLDAPGTQLPPPALGMLKERRECYVKGQPYRADR